MPSSSSPRVFVLEERQHLLRRHVFALLPRSNFRGEARFYGPPVVPPVGAIEIEPARARQRPNERDTIKNLGQVDHGLV